MASAESPAQAAPVSRRAQFLKRYLAVTTPIMSGLALVYLGVYTLQSMLYRPDQAWYGWATAFGYLLWVVFLCDLTLRFVVTKPKRGFFRANWLDTITVVIPQLRALRALRAFTSGGILARKGKGVFSGKAITTAALSAVIIIWVGSLMVLNVERTAPNATITTLADALWWAAETVTTVGYGDMIPVTWAGRIIAVFVMIFGIATVGAVSAGLAATFVKQASTTPAPADEVLAELARLQTMVAQLEQKIGVQPAPAAESAAPEPSPSA